MPVRTTVHGVLRHHLGAHVDELGRTIADDIEHKRDEVSYRLPGGVTQINADLLYRRLWLGADRDVAEILHEAQLRAVAEAAAAVPPALLTGLHARRALAAAGLAGGRQVWRSVLITPMWRVVVGHGEDSVHESSLTLSPTYGVPVLPGSALKGLAAAQARERWTEQDTRVFGAPRPHPDQAEDQDPDRDDAERGSVCIWDALPTEPPELVVDVLTPHVKPYYDQANSTGKLEADPAEYHNPVPVRFLAVGATTFRTYVLGPPRDVLRCLHLLIAALDERGIGGKTAAGYGYAEATPEGARS